jgi:serine/threonine protein phosphatase 1
MRTLAIGDIHGCLNALEALAEFVDFSPEDTIITLGDYIDRGPDSKGVIDFLLKLRKTHSLITLKGNHESMMQDAILHYEDLMNWLLNGGMETLNSFGALEFEHIASRYWEFFDSCENYHETKEHIFVHAGLLPELPLNEQAEETMLWLRFNETEPHSSGKRFICGHTPQHPRKPAVRDHAICIDTGACNGGWLTCLDVNSGNYWQANQQGKTRKGKIPLG